MSGAALLVDDDRRFLVSLATLIEDETDLAAVCVGSGQEALEAIDHRADLRVVVSDLAMPGMDGIELLREVQARAPELPFVVLTAHGSVPTAVEAMRLGAFQYLAKPVDPDELLLVVGRALERSALEARVAALEDRIGGDELLVGDSDAITSLRALIRGLADVDSTVLLRGETGTGKELVARLIHRSGRRAPRPFVVVNCTAIPAGLLESELFGHERGAFTGATELRRGRIEEAEGGTLLLDEVGDMPPDLQPKLLRFLQERTVRRVGGSRDRPVDVRVMAATHRDLEEAMAEGSFRADLFYRLATVPVRMPALRDHRGDLPAMCHHLMAKIARRIGRRPLPLSEDAVAVLARHPLPGNVRELENLLERALVLHAACGGRDPEILDAADLRLEPPPVGAGEHVALEGGFAALDERHRAAEEHLIRRAVETWPTLPNREIAERLGTNRRILELRMRQYRISKRE